MSRRRKIIAGVAAAAIALAGFIVVRASSDSGASDGVTIVPQLVAKRTLNDVVTVNGELRREELRKINSPVDGRVSEVNVEDGDEVKAGDTVFALDGRAAVAVGGDFSFFRALDVGSDGPDVLQLERILDDEGYNPGRVDELFTEETRRALAEWQLDHGYGGATPEPDEVVTVSLEANGAGYDVGEENTAAAVIVPTVPRSGASSVMGAVGARAAQVVHAAAGTPEKPSITVTASPTKVKEGGKVTFTFHSSPAPASSTTVDLTIGGAATAGDSGEDADFKEIADSFVFPAGRTSYSVSAVVFVDDVVEDDEDLSVALSDQFGDDPAYSVGPTNEAIVEIVANGENLVPVLTMTADTDLIAEDGEATLTIESDVELNTDLDIGIKVLGNATSDADYEEIDDEVTLTAGNTEVDVTVSAREDKAVEADEFIGVEILPNAQSDQKYTVGNPSQVAVRIESDNIPELTLTGGGDVNEGGTVFFTVVADQPVVDDTSVNYQTSGSAEAGTDYEAVSNTVVMAAGTDHVEIPIRTLDDDVLFQPSDMLVADWPARVGEVNVDEGEFVLQGDPVLTLTEPVFTVTILAGPSERSELKVGQKVSVDLAAGGQDPLPGVITQLDETATVAGTGEQKTETYEGTIEVTGDLAGVDGASASIDVTLEERPGVVAVPVAAVLSSGGGRQVRVVGDDGKIKRVTVKVGLVDDEFIEVTDGLKGGELVIVSVDSKGGAAEAG